MYTHLSIYLSACLPVVLLFLFFLFLDVQSSFFRINWHESVSVRALFCYLFILLCDVSNLKLLEMYAGKSLRTLCADMRMPVTESMYVWLCV